MSGQWNLVFNENTGVPVTFGVTMRPSVMSDDFDHEVRGKCCRAGFALLTRMQTHPDYVDEHPFVLDHGPNISNLERPLLTLKIVEGNGETTLTLGVPTLTFSIEVSLSFPRLVPYFGFVINSRHTFTLLKSRRRSM